MNITEHPCAGPIQKVLCTVSVWQETFLCTGCKRNPDVKLWYRDDLDSLADVTGHLLIDTRPNIKRHDQESMCRADFDGFMHPGGVARRPLLYTRCKRKTDVKLWYRDDLDSLADVP